MQGEDLALTGDLTAQSVSARSNLGLRAVLLVNVTADPSIAPGLDAPIGSLALLSGSGVWQKTGAGATAWLALVGGGGVVGPGTVNAVPKFTAPNSVGDARITDDGAQIDIGTPAVGAVNVRGATVDLLPTGNLTLQSGAANVNATAAIAMLLQTLGGALTLQAATNLIVNASDQLQLTGAGATGVRIAASAEQIRLSSVTGVVLGEAGQLVSVLGAAPIGIQNITGSRADLGVGGALNQALNALAAFGFITNNSVP